VAAWFETPVLTKIGENEALQIDLGDRGFVRVSDGPPLRPVSGDWFPLMMTLVVCSGDTLDSGVEMAGVQWANLKDVLAMSVGTAIGAHRLVAAVEATDGVTERAALLRYYFRNPTVDRRTFRKPELTRLIDAVSRIRLDDLPRVRRAFGWLNKSLLDDNKFDQYSNLYTALEVLNPLLAKKHGLTKRRAPGACGPRKPKQQRVKLRGMEYALRNLAGIGTTDMDDVILTRNRLLHGFDDISMVSQQVRRLLPHIYRAAVFALCDVADLRRECWKEYARTPYRCVIPAYVEYRGKLMGVDTIAILDGIVAPRLTLKELDAGEAVRTGIDTLTAAHKLSALFEGFGGGRFRPERRTVAAPCDPEARHASVRFDANGRTR